MKSTLSIVFLLIAFLSHTVIRCNAQQSGLQSETGIQVTISADSLLKDAEILENVLRDLHPGLKRYADMADFDANMAAFKTTLNKEMSITEAYIAFSKFVATLQCGHTNLNPWNQPDMIKQAIYDHADKLPFTFQLLGRRMIVNKSVAQQSLLNTGTEILAINGVSVDTILDSLMTVSTADGANNGKRINNLQLSGLGDYEYFDIYFPLLFPPVNNRYTLSVAPADQSSESPLDISVDTITRTQRTELLTSQYGLTSNAYDDLWVLDFPNQHTAHLKLGTFVTWKMEMDWKAFIEDALEQIRSKNISHLILDIRGNEGGSTDVSPFLQRRITPKTLTIKAQRDVARFQKVSDQLRPYLSTWDNKIFDLSNNVIEEQDGFYRSRFKQPIDRTIKPGENPFTGNVYLLVDASNSSATFLMAQIFQSNGIGTIIGEETGGNLKGTNGGMIFFLNLPHTKIEIDIPVFATYPLTEQPDRGLLPDIRVKQTIEDLIAGEDTVLNHTLDLIGN
ncbi:MAG: S41 family peptidase [Rhodothermales bacterium]